MNLDNKQNKRTFVQTAEIIKKFVKSYIKIKIIELLLC